MYFNKTLQILAYPFSFTGQVVLPKRPGFGTCGRKIRLSANFFDVSYPNHDIFHYDVSILPSSCPRQLNREVIERLVAAYEPIFGGHKPVYDGRRNIYTIRPLPINKTKVG